MVAVGFIPRLGASKGRVAERRMSPARYFQSSLRDEGSLGTLNRGLKATATITKSLRAFGTAQGKKVTFCQRLDPH
jgi:hypothetical protein